MLSSIMVDVFNLIATLGETTYYPNIEPVDLPSVEHLRIDVMPNNTDSMGLTGVDKEMGIIQVRVFSTVNTGVINGTQKAEEVIALFPRGLTLSSCRIDKTGSINQSFIDGSWLVTPVIFEYQNLTGA